MHGGQGIERASRLFLASSGSRLMKSQFLSLYAKTAESPEVLLQD